MGLYWGGYEKVSNIRKDAKDIRISDKYKRASEDALCFLCGEFFLMNIANQSPFLAPRGAIGGFSEEDFSHLLSRRLY